MLNLDAERINVPLTMAVLHETRWFPVAEDAERLPSGLMWTQVFASPQIPDVLLAKTDEGDFFWYEDVRYPMHDPFAVTAMFEIWNRAHGFMQH